MAASGVLPIRIPDEFVVWAASDLHGQLGAVDRLLGRAGLTDGADSWTAPAGTAFVVTGDVVDRGPDSLGLVRRLASLRAQARHAGGLVAILEGNHEAQVLGGLGGETVPFQDLDRFERSADRLWIRDGFFASSDPFPDAEPWASYRGAGISRVVFGHTPVERPTLSHAGHALNLDTWRGQQVTLARLEPGRELRDAAFIAEPAEPRAIADAPVSDEEIRRFDA